MTSSNSEESFEFGHDGTFDVSADAGERAQDMAACGWPSVSERYVAGEVELHLHFRLREPEVADYCAVYKRTTEGDFDSVPDEARVHHEGTTRPPFAPAFSKSIAGPAHEAQTLVPIYASEFVEKVQFVVPTLVRLQLMDSCSYLRVHRPDLMHTGSVVVPAGGVPIGLLEGLPSVADGEADGSLGGFAGAFGGASPGEVVEGAPHVLKRIPDDEAKRRRLLEHLRPEDVLAAVCIGLMGNSIRFSGVEGGKLVAENFQVLACPNEFEASTCEGVGHGKQQYAKSQAPSVREEWCEARA
jgi:hypothetical protein